MISLVLSNLLHLISWEGFIIKNNDLIHWNFTFLLSEVKCWDLTEFYLFYVLIIFCSRPISQEVWLLKWLILFIKNLTFNVFFKKRFSSNVVFSNVTNNFICLYADIYQLQHNFHVIIHSSVIICYFCVSFSENIINTYSILLMLHGDAVVFTVASSSGFVWQLVVLLQGVFIFSCMHGFWFMHLNPCILISSKIYTNIWSISLKKRIFLF